MSRSYPTEVQEAIWALRCEGKYATEIARLLNNGDAGLEQPFPASVHTVTDWIERLKKQRGEPKTFIAPGREEDAASNLRRMALDRARKELEKLNALDEMSASEAKMFVFWAKYVDDVTIRLKQMSAEKDPERVEAGRNRAPRRSILAQIAAAEAKMPAGGGADEPAPATNGEVLTPNTHSPLEDEQPAEGPWDPYGVAGQ